MCCNSHQGMGTGAQTFDPEAATEETRCKCRGVGPNDQQLVTYTGTFHGGECACLRPMDGEDLRCSLCREHCPEDATPRIMSKQFAAASKS